MAQIIANRPSAPPFRINNFAGINMSATATQIADNESPDMLNIQRDEVGASEKRPGYKRVYANSLGAGKINGMHQFKKTDGTKVFLIHHGTTLYTQVGSAQPVQLYTGMVNERSRSFMFGDKLYLMDGTNYLVYNGVAVTDVTAAAYTPTLRIATTPAGSGQAFEDFNLLSPAFKVSFSADGAATVFKLGVTTLDATALTAVVNGAAMNENAGFTVNRATGDVTFSAAPTTGVPNNVVITAHKTHAGFANRIKKCRLFVIYGGTNDTRVFVAGNPGFPNTQWRCGVADPTYFGENMFQEVGSDASAITGYAKQYASCVIMKESVPNDTVIWNMNYALAQDGITATFPVTPLNDQVGCSAMDSVQLIENTPAYLNASMGVYFIYGSNVRDERNVQNVSDNIDPSLLSQSGLSSAVSIDFEKKYILVVGNMAYVCDYRQKYINALGDAVYPWYIWDNVPASCLLEIDGILYFGSNVDGIVYRFKKSSEFDAYNDDGQAINAYWKSKVFSFNSDEYLKLVEKVFFSLKPGRRASADLFYATDKTESGTAIAVQVTARVDLFDFADMEFDHFSFMTSSLPQEVAAKIKAKKIIYFQLILSNNRLNESMGILGLGMKVRMQREVK